MERAEKGRDRLGDSLSECEPPAPRVRSERADDAHRQFEGDGDGRFDGGHRSLQFGRLFEVTVRLASRQLEFVLEPPCRIRHLGLLIEQPIGGIHQAGFVRFRRSRHVT